MAIFRRFSGLGSRKVPFIVGVLAAVGLLVTAGTFGIRAGAAACDNNNIIQCGFSSKTDFINMVQANSDGHGHNDLQAIYNHFNFSSADYSNFENHAVAGEAMRDGRIIVNGQVVATASRSLGRQKLESSDTPVPIGGTTYFENTLAQRFASGVNELAVDVLFDSSGAFQFAVMPSCGNPIIPTPVKTSAACQMLSVQSTSNPNAFTFTANATKVGNATIDKFVFNFGDGTSVSVPANGTAATTSHTYKAAGTFTATVTAFATFPGGSSHALPAIAQCSKQVKVTPPAAVVAVACINLAATMIDDNKMAFTFTATAKSSGGATLTSADFDFGDGNTQNGVKPNGDGTTATTQHTYATAGTFTSNAVLHFTDNNGKPVTAAACSTTVTPAITPPPPTPTPTPTPVPTPTPTVLPNTGAGNTVAIASAAVVAGSLGYRQWLFRRHKHAG